MQESSNASPWILMAHTLSTFKLHRTNQPRKTAWMYTAARFCLADSFSWCLYLVNFGKHCLHTIMGIWHATRASTVVNLLNFYVVLVVHRSLLFEKLVHRIDGKKRVVERVNFGLIWTSSSDPISGAGWPRYCSRHTCTHSLLNKEVGLKD